MATKYLVQTTDGGHEFQEPGTTTTDRQNFAQISTAQRDVLLLTDGTTPIIYNWETSRFEIKIGITWYGLSNTSESYSKNGNAFGADTVLGTTDNYNVKFYSNNAERMRLLTSGTLVIGEIAAIGSEKLRVAGNTRLEGTALITGATTLNADVEIGAGYTNGGGKIRMMNLYGHIEIGPLVKLLPDSNATVAGNIYIGDGVASAMVVDVSFQDSNTLIGQYVLRSATNQGRYNTILGAQAGISATLFGTSNTIIGANAFGGQTGLGSSNYNVAIGNGAGYNSVSSVSIFLGYQAGYYETGNNKLFIHNSLGVTTEALGRTQSLIYGEMTGVQQTQKLVVNGSLIVGSAILPLTATGGFLYIPVCNGVPTASPPTLQTGTVPIVYDSADNKIYVYNGGWKFITFGV